MSKQINGIHSGHRSRLRQRFLKQGIEGFEPHNILEILLFYGIPYRDTNDIAHKLIDKFGSLEGVFDADIKELTKIDGIGENSATLIKLVPQISKYYKTMLRNTLLAHPCTHNWSGMIYKLQRKANLQASPFVLHWLSL